MGIWEHTRKVGCRAGGRWDLRSPDQAGCRDRFQQRFPGPPPPPLLREDLESSEDETCDWGW